MGNVYANLNCWCKQTDKNRSHYQSLSDENVDDPKGKHINYSSLIDKYYQKIK